MDRRYGIWAIRAGIGGGACALLTLWMVPDTTPTARPSVIAGMAATAEAQKPTYSAVPDAAIPAWAANLRQAPVAVPAGPPSQVADASPPPDAEPTTAPPVSGDGQSAADPSRMADDMAPPALVTADSEPSPTAITPPAPGDGYQARRAAWQAQLDTVMEDQRGPG